MNDADIWKQKTLEYGARITKLLSTDIQSFISGMIRTRFIEAPAFADALSDTDIKTLKDGARALAEAQAARMGDLLTPKAWLSTQAVERDTPITAHPVVSGAVDSLQAAVQAFLEENAFPAAGPVEYRLPARFIDGETLPSLSRQYWRSLGEWQALESQAAEVHASTQAEQRRSRWDDA